MQKTLRGFSGTGLLVTLSSWEMLSFAGNPCISDSWKQECYLGLNGFYDFGKVTKDIKLPATLEGTFNTIYPSEKYTDYFKPGPDKLHQSAGASVMLVMNQNFVVAIDCGKAFNEQDGNIGFSIGIELFVLEKKFYRI